MIDGFSVSDNRKVVEALRHGDEAAFEVVYLEYNDALRSYATVILQDAEIAAEIVQDTFMAIWINRKRLDAEKPLRNYLLRAVHNNALRYRKSFLLRKAREEKAVVEHKESLGEEEMEGNKKLTPAIERLPEQSRRVLVKSYWENKKNKEIAEELSISVRTVETILYKVIKKLRREIKK